MAHEGAPHLWSKVKIYDINTASSKKIRVIGVICGPYQLPQRSLLWLLNRIDNFRDQIGNLAKLGICVVDHVKSDRLLVLSQGETFVAMG